MELELRNLKGTKDYIGDEQQFRIKIQKILEEVFEKYSCKPIETPTICYFDVLASKYAGGAEILKEVYKMKDQGNRELGLRYDLTVPFAKVIGMNPNMKLPFKRYEIGKVFRDGPIKTGRMREFIQCDVDVVGIKSVMAEAELMAMGFEVFERLNLDVYASYNNRKFLTGFLYSMKANENDINEIILSLDKIKKISEEGVRQELIEKGIGKRIIEDIFKVLNQDKLSLDFFKNNFNNSLLQEGIIELEEFEGYLKELGFSEEIRFDPCLARGLDIYTGTVYEMFLSDSTISSSIGGGGRFDKIIGAFLNNGIEYPAVGISFGLDVIFAALTLEKDYEVGNYTDIFIIPMGTENEAMKIAQLLRQNSYRVEIEMIKRKLKKSLDYANKENIPYVIIIGEDEVQKGVVNLKDMKNGNSRLVEVNEILNNI